MKSLSWTVASSLSRSRGFNMFPTFCIYSWSLQRYVEHIIGDAISHCSTIESRRDLRSDCNKNTFLAGCISSSVSTNHLLVIEIMIFHRATFSYTHSNSHPHSYFSEYPLDIKKRLASQNMETNLKIG